MRRLRKYTCTSEFHDMASTLPIILPARSLNPFTLYDTAAATTAPNVLPAGNVGLLPLDMDAVNLMQVIVTQVFIPPMGEQDYAMRAWVSEYPNGLSVLERLPDNTFTVSRFTPRPLYLFTPGQTAPSGDVILAPVSNQRYFLNVQNLTNTMCAFSFSQSILA